MKIPAAYKSATWWKQYLIYMAIVMPLLVADYLFIPGGNWVHAGILLPVIIGAQIVQGRIQRRIWP